MAGGARWPGMIPAGLAPSRLAEWISFGIIYQQTRKVGLFDDAPERGGRSRNEWFLHLSLRLDMSRG
jgi:hypothetical protein